jgi:hypothetical protein
VTNTRGPEVYSTVIADATFNNQPPNCRQNSDRGMWRSWITVIAYERQ